MVRDKGTGKARPVDNDFPTALTTALTEVRRLRAIRPNGRDQTLAQLRDELGFAISTSADTIRGKAFHSGPHQLAGIIRFLA